MKTTRFWLGLMLIGLLSQGCGVYLAATQPDKVDYQALTAGGLPRDVLVARLGTPMNSVKHEDGTRTDVYSFYEGSNAGWKYGRAAFHFVADLFTLALWEIVATPTEMAIKGTKVSARAEFDRNETLREFRLLDGRPQGLAKGS